MRATPSMMRWMIAASADRRPAGAELAEREGTSKRQKRPFGTRSKALLANLRRHKARQDQDGSRGGSTGHFYTQSRLTAAIVDYEVQRVQTRQKAVADAERHEPQRETSA
jgi:hypothetical protein